MQLCNNCVKLPILIFTIASLFLYAESASKEKPKENAKTAVAPNAGTNSTNATENGLSGSSCRKFMLVMAKRMMKVLTSCTKEVKKQFKDDGSFNDHFQCTIKCFMHKTQMIDSNFMLSKTSWETFVTVHLPENYFVLAQDVSKPCLETYASKIDPNDPKCVLYGEFIKCLQDIAAKACV